jgi:hypothetical protein
MVENFFEDVIAYKWDLHNLDPFLLASWARGRILGGAKSARASVRQILAIVQASTGLIMHLDHPLVTGQLSPGADSTLVEEPTEHARDSSVEMIMKFEELVLTAPTSQMRCFAAFFSLLGSSSLRA